MGKEKPVWEELLPEGFVYSLHSSTKPTARNVFPCFRWKKAMKHVLFWCPPSQFNRLSVLKRTFKGRLTACMTEFNYFVEREKLFRLNFVPCKEAYAADPRIKPHFSVAAFKIIRTPVSGATQLFSRLVNKILLMGPLSCWTETFIPEI